MNLNSSFQRLLTIFSLVVFIGTVHPAFAHVGGHGRGSLHTWTLRGGGHVSGTLHSFRGDTVMIEDHKGQIKSYAISMLSSADAHYALDRIARIQSRNLPTSSTKHQEMVRNSYTNDLDIAGSLMVYGSFALVIVFAGLLLTVALRRRRSGRRYAAAWYAGAATVVVSAMLVGSVNATVKRVLLGTDPLTIDSSFAAFKPHVTTRWDNVYFYVECDGMPLSMPAMKGITAWQQQVPIPQSYFGTNAWSIPLAPIPAAVPVSLDTALHTGAVAIAVNGLPIFNPENNRGEFSFDIGELDQFGGHCGRADDYHYHIAPVHLTSIVGEEAPIAWALDGYPLYGYKEPDGSNMITLDANLGHTWRGQYHYHATTTRPYMIAAMRGKITIDRDQVMPQAQTKGVRPFLQPLNGAAITDYHKCDSNHYALKYTVNGASSWVNYRWTPSGLYTYVFVSPDGTRRTETYQRK